MRSEYHKSDVYMVEYRVYKGHGCKIKIVANSHKEAKEKAERKLTKGSTVLSTEKI